MESNFWEKLNKPFFVLAPMEDVTDIAFRTLIAKYGKPDVMFTEFTSADGLLLADDEGKKKLMRKLSFTDAEHPIVAQLFTSVPEHMERAAALVQEMGFDGLDINMGCPDRAVEKQGCGAAMIKNHELAREIIRAAKRGAPNIPVSVKTRAGYSRDEELDEWVRVLLEENIAALTIHARTRKDMSKVPARWELIQRAVEIRDEMGAGTLILGNGDVKDVENAKEKVKEAGCDGVMLGRAIYGNPWLFADFAHTRCGCKIEHPSQTLPLKKFQRQNNNDKIQIAHATQSRNRPSDNRSECVANSIICKVCGGHIVTPDAKIRALIEHLDLFEKLLADTTNYAVMKKHFKAYIAGWPACRDERGAGREGAKELRMLLMDTKYAKEAIDILHTA